MRKITKRILAGIMSAAMISSFAACSGDDSGTGGGGTTTAPEATTTTTAKTEWTGDLVEVEIDESALNTDVDISGKTLKWMGFTDLNPTNTDPDRSVELSIFEDTYGAKIEYMETTNGTRFDDLANAIIGGNPPDIFLYEWRSFPYDVNKGQYQPIDSLVDWSDPLWAEVKETADMFMWNGEHYVAPFGYRFADNQILMYDRDMVEEEGLEDPYELYEAGNWDWDAFVRLQKEFQGGDETRFGIAGWWANAFVYTAGDTLVKFDGTNFTNNINSAKVEAAQAVLNELQVNSLIKAGWVGPESAFVNGDLLFYGMGTWAYDGAAETIPDHYIQVVPFPKQPGSNTNYLSKALNSHMWVKGSDNADCVKVWYDINRLVNSDPQYQETAKQKYLSNHPLWPEEVYDLVKSFDDDEKFVFAFDYGYGLSDFMGDEIMGILYEGRTNEQWESWTTAREEYSSIIDSAITDLQ